MTVTSTAQSQPTVAPRPGSRKTVVFVFAILCIQLGFILSYVGAFHAPKADGISLLVVAPTAVQGDVVTRLNALDDAPVSASPASSENAALTALRQGDVSGVFTIDATGTTDTLTVASAGGGSVATALETIVQQVDATQNRTVIVADAIPAQAGDSRALTGFYMVTGWLIGGYLLAAVLGILLGTTLTGVRQAVARISIFVPYAVLSGIGGAVVVDQGLNAVTGHFWPLAFVGALVVMTGAMVTVALQTFLGIIGVGISIVIFVVLGNPSAGGAFQPELLPTFWQKISQSLPNGAATSVLRNIVYFDSHHIAPHLVLLTMWLVAGLSLTVLAAVLRDRKVNQRPAAVVE